MTELAVQLTREDALAAARLNHLAYVFGRYCAAVVGSVAILGAGLAYVALGQDGAALRIAVAVALAIVVLFYGLLAVRHAILPPFIVRREFKERRSAHDVHYVTWSQDSYRVRGPTMQSDVPWGDYWRWRENGRVLLLYVSSRQFQLLPKRLLPPGAVEDVRAHLDKAGVKRASLVLS